MIKIELNVVEAKKPLSHATSCDMTDAATSSQDQSMPVRSGEGEEESIVV